MAAAYLNDLEYLEDDLNGMFDFDNLADDGFGFDMHDHLHEDLHAEIVDYFDNPVCLPFSIIDILSLFKKVLHW